MLGEALALGAAGAWAVSVILFKRSEVVSPQALNLFKNVVGMVLIGLTLLVAGQGVDLGRPAGEWLRLAASGVLGIAVADTLFFMALKRLGPGLLAIVECVYAPCIVTLSILFLGERPGPGFGLGALLVVGGILYVTTERAPQLVRLAADRRERMQGIACGVLGVAAMAAGVVIAKPLIERDPLLEVSLVRLVAGVLGQLAWIGLSGEVSALAVLRPAPVWKTLVPAAVLGAYVSMLLWLGGFKWADASVAAVLNQMTAVFIIVLGRVMLGEVVSTRRAIGGAVAVAGALVIFVVPGP